MKKSFTNFWRRNLAFSHLAIVTNLEYRLNYFTDAIVQPLLATGIDVTLWLAVFATGGSATIGGFDRNDYLAYVLWAAFVARITSNWMYEFRMLDEIESGSVNSLITRPLSFYEYYLSQFLSYKLITTGFSMVCPFIAIWWLGLPTNYAHLLPALGLVVYYLFLVHTLSFCVSTLAFRFTKVGSFTMAKNLILWLLSGELFPLDLMPEPWRHWVLALPFANAVYIPVGYITGRVDTNLLLQGYLTTTAGLVGFGLIGAWLWRTGLRDYSGTGA